MACYRVASATRRHGGALLVLLLLGLSAGLALAHDCGGQAAAPVYVVSQICAVLTHHPAPWMGRTVQVRGNLEGPFVFCGASRPCPPPTLGLIDNGNESIGPGQYLPVLAEPPAQPWVSLPAPQGVPTCSPDAI
jgi:hypothetical protein